MNRRIEWLARTSMVLCIAATACGPASSGNDAGADTGMSGPTILGRYVLSTDVAAQTALVGEIHEMRELAEMTQFAQIEARLAPTSGVGQMLTRLDVQFSGAAGAASEDGLERRLRAALTAGAMASAASARTAAAEVVEKSLLVLIELALLDEAALTRRAAQQDQWTEAASHWDRAAVYFSELEPKVRTRSNGMIPSVWGAGTSAITDENMADRTIQILVDGRNAVTNRARVGAVELSARLGAYSAKYFFLSAMNYAHGIETAAMGADTSVQRAEGGAFFEGVVLAVLAGSPPPTTVVTARGRWRGGAMPGTISRLASVRDSAQLMSDALAQALASYAMSGTDDDQRAALRARADATLDVFDEALVFAAQDVTMLRARVVAAAQQSSTGDHAGAATLLGDVQRAIAAIARVGM